MKIMVSACLAGENCKYNGGNNRNDRLMELLAGHEIITVCPEQLGGLPTPRVPSEICSGVVMAQDGRNVEREFRAGAGRCLEIAMREQPDLIVLQSRSPSCGVKQRYDGTFSGTLVEGMGVTAELLIGHGFRVVDAEDLSEITRRLTLGPTRDSGDHLANAARSLDVCQAPEAPDLGAAPGFACDQHGSSRRCFASAR